MMNEPMRTVRYRSSKVKGRIRIMKTETEGNLTVIYLDEQITSANARDAEQELLRIEDETSGEILLDAQNLTYISSAGLRALLSLTKNRRQKLAVRNVSPEIYEIFEITGFTELLDVRRRMRRVSVEGCEKIGQGALGEVYRVNPDTIVKVFKSADSLPLARTELARSRQAFVKGLPTAIPFDIVQVDDRYGAIYELLNAETMNDYLIRNPGRTDEVIRRYVRLMQQIHATQVLPGELPSAVDVFLQYIEELNGILPANTASCLEGLLREMPEDLHIVHGDLQMKNVMLSGDELLLIDLETLSAGSPLFDLQGIFMAYKAFLEDEPDNSERFLGISGEQCNRIWKGVLSEYFKNESPERIRQWEDRIRILGYLHFLDRIVTHNMTIPELKEIRIRHTLEQLDALLENVKASGGDLTKVDGKPMPGIVLESLTE